MSSDLLEAVRATGGDVKAAGEALGIPESTFRRRLKSEGLWSDVEALRNGAPAADAAGVVNHDDGSLTYSTEASSNPPAPWKPEEVIRAHGGNPDNYEIVRVRFNRWGTTEEPMHQLRFDAIPRAEIVYAADPVKWAKPAKPKKATKGERSVVLCGDQHAPLHDQVLHRLFCSRLAELQPDEGVLLGDLLDFSNISRFREREGFAHGVNECLQAGFQILRDYREASPSTRWTMLKGNHDARLEHAILDNNSKLHGIRGADEELPALSLRRLLHLDDLGIEFIEGEWDTTKHVLSRNLTARHGFTTAKNAAEQMLSRLSRSTVQGHSHRLSLGYRTEHDDGEPATSTRVAAEAGCMCEIHEGLGYSVDPNWQQGHLEAHIWPDGDFSLTPALYVPGRLLCPGGKRYE